MFPLIVSFSPCSEITFKSPDPFETPDFCLKKKIPSANLESASQSLIHQRHQGYAYLDLDLFASLLLSFFLSCRALPQFFVNKFPFTSYIWDYRKPRSTPLMYSTFYVLFSITLKYELFKFQWPNLFRDLQTS